VFVRIGPRNGTSEDRCENPNALQITGNGDPGEHRSPHNWSIPEDNAARIQYEWARSDLHN
jgi:hypothetical protein